MKMLNLGKFITKNHNNDNKTANKEDEEKKGFTPMNINKGFICLHFSNRLKDTLVTKQRHFEVFQRVFVVFRFPEFRTC